MFWKKVEGLTSLPVSSKVAITLFLCIAGIGYLLGFANIYLSYSPVDGKPGLSIADVRIAFSGSGSGSTLEKALDGSMKQYVDSEADAAKIKAWLKAGAKEADFGSVKEILANSCVSCHSADAKAAGVVLETYADVSPLLKADTGMSVSRLVSLSHMHVLATITILFLLCLVFSFTAFTEPVKIIVMAFSLASIAADIGSWWLAKFVSAFAVLVILGGMCLAVAFLALIVLSLYDLWLKKAG